MITEEEIKRRVENNSGKFPFTEEECAYMRKIPFDDWNDIDLALKVRDMIGSEFFS